MFDFLRKKKDSLIYAPAKGLCIDISNVDDNAFASKIMGDGVAIIPEENIIKSPVDGKLTMIFNTGHAFGILSNDGVEILIHIGIDTVNEEGKGFEILKKSGDSVKKGTPIVKLELNYLKSKYDMSTMLIVTNNKKIKKINLNNKVDENTPILERIE